MGGCLATDELTIIFVQLMGGCLATVVNFLWVINY